MIVSKHIYLRVFACLLLIFASPVFPHSACVAASNMGGDPEDELDDDVEEDVENDAEDEAEDQAEDEAEDSAEDEAEDLAEDEAEDGAQDEAEEQAEDEAENEAEDEAEGDAEDDAEDDAENEAEDEAEDGANESDGDSGESEVAEHNLPELEPSFDNTLELVGVDQDDHNFDIARDEWLVLSSSDELKRFVGNGFTVRSSEQVAVLGSVLSRLEPPKGIASQEARLALLRLAPQAEIEYNHLYAPQSYSRRSGASGRLPLDAMPFARGHRSTSKRIGLIDTAIERTNPVLASSHITTRDLVNSRNPRPYNHGTAVASILVGKSKTYAGLLPNASLFAASVFEKIPGRGDTASTASLVRALNWMSQNDVKIVNMSLSGPPNRILQRAITGAQRRGMVVVAAAGNEGPASAPLYPAAYDGVVSVTAVDAKNHVLRRANRGDFLDFAAPGVSIRHARGKAQLSSSSGTSIAAPFVSATLLTATRSDGSLPPVKLHRLEARALDLGKPGRDDVYGYGLIRP